MMHGIISRGIVCAFLCLAKAGKVTFEHDRKLGNVLEKHVIISDSEFNFNVV